MANSIPFSLEGKRIWVAGHRGMVGSALARRLAREDCEVVTVDRASVDLKNQAQTRDWLLHSRPQAVFLAAARVGGILANDRFPADFLYDNLMIEANIIEASREAGVEKLLFLGSSCIYPKFADQPIVEESLLTGSLEPTNEWYAIAKIAGIKLTQAYRRQFGCDFISAMPTNLYGPEDNFDLQSSHVLPALLRKAHDARQTGARELTVWGSGAPRREFLHVDDCADALVFLMRHYSEDIRIDDLARLVSSVVGFNGALTFDRSKPDGTPRKLMSGERLRGLGWTPQISLEQGIAQTYQWFVETSPRIDAARAPTEP